MEKKENIEYHSEFYNKTNETEQWIRLSDGCGRGCWNCYAPKEKLWYPLPNIVRNKVVILDMNFIYAYPNPVETIKKLGSLKVNNRVIYYDFYCGLDFTMLTEDLIFWLKKGRFGRLNNKRMYKNGLRIAWDRGIIEKDIFIKAMENMLKVGYSKQQIQIFMLCNGKVSFQECVLKLKVLKELRLQIADCWYDNQIRGSVEPVYWTKEECVIFGKLCRAHNIAIMQNQYFAMDYLYDNSENN